MNKFVKISLIGVVLVLVLGVAFYSKLFIIGNKSFESIVIDKVTVSRKEAIIDGKFTDSTRAYKDFSYTQVGNELYVIVKSVLVSKKYDKGSFSLKIPVNGMEVRYIHLSDDKNTKVIYSNTEL